ncbi:hypothetical protein HK097_002589, partial [Rhizophlyctis rosea]
MRSQTLRLCHNPRSHRSPSKQPSTPPKRSTPKPTSTSRTLTKQKNPTTPSPKSSNPYPEFSQEEFEEPPTKPPSSAVKSHLNPKAAVEKVQESACSTDAIVPPTDGHESVGEKNVKHLNIPSGWIPDLRSDFGNSLRGIESEVRKGRVGSQGEGNSSIGINDVLGLKRFERKGETNQSLGSTKVGNSLLVRLREFEKGGVREGMDALGKSHSNNGLSDVLGSAARGVGTGNLGNELKGLDAGSNAKDVDRSIGRLTTLEDLDHLGGSGEDAQPTATNHNGALQHIGDDMDEEDDDWVSIDEPEDEEQSLYEGTESDCEVEEVEEVDEPDIGPVVVGLKRPAGSTLLAAAERLQKRRISRMKLPNPNLSAFQTANADNEAATPEDDDLDGPYNPTNPFDSNGQQASRRGNLHSKMLAAAAGSEKEEEPSIVDQRRDDESSTPLNQPPTSPTNAPNPTTTKQYEILLAQNHTTDRDRTIGMLKELGHMVKAVVADGLSAVEAFQRDRFDIILMDIQMAIMTGLDATRRIRAIEAMAMVHTPIPRIPMVAVSPDGGVIGRLKAIEVGFDVCMMAPFGVEELRTVIERAVRCGVSVGVGNGGVGRGSTSDRQKEGGGGEEGVRSGKGGVRKGEVLEFGDGVQFEFSVFGASSGGNVTGNVNGGANLTVTEELGRGLRVLSKEFERNGGVRGKGGGKGKGPVSEDDGDDDDSHKKITKADVREWASEGVTEPVLENVSSPEKAGRDTLLEDSDDDENDDVERPVSENHSTPLISSNDSASFTSAAPAKFPSCLLLENANRVVGVQGGGKEDENEDCGRVSKPLPLSPSKVSRNGAYGIKPIDGGVFVQAAVAAADRESEAQEKNDRVLKKSGDVSDSEDDTISVYRDERAEEVGKAVQKSGRENVDDGKTRSSVAIPTNANANAPSSVPTNDRAAPITVEAQKEDENDPNTDGNLRGSKASTSSSYLPKAQIECDSEDEEEEEVDNGILMARGPRKDVGE